MTLTEAVKREVGQHFVLGFHGYEVSQDIKTLVKEYFVGNIILMKRNAQNAYQVRSLVEQLQTIAKEAGHQKLLIGTDQECGLVSAMTMADGATQFPGAMTLAATDSLSTTEQVYEATGKELKTLGLSWAYSPVADVNSEWRNPVIGVRSFGDNAAVVGQYAKAAARGLSRAGIAPCAKHFPGHGDTHVDSHLALPVILKTEEQLQSKELVPFKSLLQTEANWNPIASIMTGHMALPLITGSNEPCSLSKTITRNLLRDEMGFKGVIVTDCLEMDAIASSEQGGPGIAEGTIRALEAGADIVMICHTFEEQVKAIESTYEAIESGRLNYDELVESGLRVSSMKDTFVQVESGSGGGFENSWKGLKDSHALLSQRAYEDSIAMLQQGSLPLPKEGKVVVFTPEVTSLNKAVDDAEGVLRGKGGQVRNTAGESFSSFARSIRQRVACDHYVYDQKEQELESKLDGMAAIVLVLRSAERELWQLNFLNKVVQVAKERPVVLVASCTPYDLVGVKGVEHCNYLACFEYTAQALEAVSKVIFGEISARGRVPVNLAV